MRTFNSKFGPMNRNQMEMTHTIKKSDTDFKEIFLGRVSSMVFIRMLFLCYLRVDESAVEVDVLLFSSFIDGIGRCRVLFKYRRKCK